MYAKRERDDDDDGGGERARGTTSTLAKSSQPVVLPTMIVQSAQPLPHVRRATHRAPS